MPDLLTIGDVAQRSGVAASALRFYEERGLITSERNSGGHRRFARSSILGLLPTPRPRRRRLNELGETPDRVVRQYRRELADRRASHAWLKDLPEAERETFREPGRRILAGVLGFLDAATPDEGETSLTDALNAAAHYGAMARVRAIDIDAVTDTFLQFRLPFLHELGRIAQRRRLHTDEAMDLILAASRVFDRLLLALLRGHREVAAGPAALQ